MLQSLWIVEDKSVIVAYKYVKSVFGSTLPSTCILNNKPISWFYEFYSYLYSSIFYKKEIVDRTGLIE